MASIRVGMVSVSKQWFIGEHLHVNVWRNSCGFHSCHQSCGKSNGEEQLFCEIIKLSNYMGFVIILDIKGIEILCEEKQVNIILSGIFVCYINTVSLFWHDLIFDRSHGSELFDSDVVKASRFGEQAFERPCIRSGLAVLNSSMPCIVW